MRVAIRPVERGEIPILRDLAVETFITAFGKHNDKKDMQSYLDQSLTLEEIEKQYNDQESAFYFAMLGDKPIGYLKYNFGAAQTENELENALEIERIYVHEEYQGKRIGQQLFEFAMNKAHDLRLEWIWLGVWENNKGAIRFYERVGFEQFGTHTFTLGEDVQTDILMRVRVPK